MTAEEEAAAAVPVLSGAETDVPDAGEFEAAAAALTECAEATSLEEIEACAREKVDSVMDTTSAGVSAKQQAVSFVVAALAGFGALVN